MRTPSWSKWRTDRRWWTIDEMYCDMKRDRHRGALEQKMDSRRRLMSATLTIWFMLLVGLGTYMYLTTKGLVPQVRQPFELKEPLLKGPPQFILLALIVALSAYLRQVRSSAVEQRDKIANGELWNYPLEPPYLSFTERKLRLLDGVAYSLTVATPFFISLFVILTVRASFDAMDRFRDWGGQVAKALCVADFFIVIWVLFVFIAITRSHFVARFRDDAIRAVARDHELEIRAKIKLEKAKDRDEALTKLASELVRLSNPTYSENREESTISARKPPTRKIKTSSAIGLGLLVLAAMALAKNESGD